MRITSLLFLSTFVMWVFAAGSAPPTRYHESQRTQLNTERGIKLGLAARGHTETRYLATGLRKRGPPAPAKTITASKTATGPNKSTVGAACKRKLHRRSIYDTLVARGECDITLTLTTITDGKETSVTDTFSGENNLGATSMGNEGVYEIAKWGAQNGPFIAKKFKNMGQMETEASFLRVLCQLVAFSPPGSSDSESWIVMKAVPGTYLKQTKEWNDAQSLPVAQYNTFVKGKREALVNEVLRVYDTIKGKVPKLEAAHGDLKDENVHWANQACGTLTPQLLDFGRMWSDNKVQAYLKRFGHPVAAASAPGWERANVMTYATARAASMYPDRA